MERDLDRIAAGEEDRVAWLRRFYNGQGGPASRGLPGRLGRARRRGRRAARPGAQGPGGQPRRDRRPRRQLHRHRRGHHSAGGPLRPLPGGRGGQARQRAGRPRPRRADRGQGPRAVHERRRRRPRARRRPGHRARHHRQGRPVRALRHRGPARAGGDGRGGERRRREDCEDAKTRTIDEGEEDRQGASPSRAPPPSCAPWTCRRSPSSRPSTC